MKRLYKSRKNKVIDGVCGGIAEYFEVDPVLVRIIFVLFFFLGGSAILAYIVGMIIMPHRPPEEEAGESKEQAEADKSQPMPVAAAEKPDQVKAPAVSSGALVVGIVLIVLGALFLLKNFPFFHWDIWWFFDRYFWKYLIPGLLMAVGIVLIIRSGAKKPSA